MNWNDAAGARQAARRAAQWTEIRDRRICEAVAMGASFREVARAVEMSASAVHKIVHRDRPSAVKGST